MFAAVLIPVTAAMQVYATWLERPRWREPRTVRIFGLTPDPAAEITAMAASQRLCTGFIGAGLLAGPVFGAPLMLGPLPLCAVVARGHAAYCGIIPAPCVPSRPAALARPALAIGC